MEEVYRDFDWELDRFAEYRLLIINSILNSILAVIYVTKLQNLINRPVMKLLLKVIHNINSILEIGRASCRERV